CPNAALQRIAFVGDRNPFGLEHLRERAPQRPRTLATAYSYREGAVVRHDPQERLFESVGPEPRRPERDERAARHVHPSELGRLERPFGIERENRAVRPQKALRRREELPEHAAATEAERNDDRKKEEVNAGARQHEREEEPREQRDGRDPVRPRRRS